MTKPEDISQKISEAFRKLNVFDGKLLGKSSYFKEKLIVEGELVRRANSQSLFKKKAFIKKKFVLDLQLSTLQIDQNGPKIGIELTSLNKSRTFAFSSLHEVFLPIKEYERKLKSICD